MQQSVSEQASSYDKDQNVCQDRLEFLFQTDQNPNPALACLSVRSAFDLCLKAYNFPSGSQVIMSAINVPSMFEIVRAHGLNPVAWDVDVNTMAPNLSQLQSLYNGSTVAIVLAHVFGK